MSYQSFSLLQEKKKQKTTLISLFHVLQYARQEAIYRNNIVQVGIGPCGIEVFIENEPTHKKIPLRTLQGELFNSISSNQPHGFKFLADGRCATPGTISFRSPKGLNYKIVINDSGRSRIVLAE